MKIENFKLNDPQLGMPTAEVVTLFGLRREKFICIAINPLTGGTWSNLATGRWLGLFDRRTALHRSALYGGIEV